MPELVLAMVNSVGPEKPMARQTPKSKKTPRKKVKATAKKSPKAKNTVKKRTAKAKPRKKFARGRADAGTLVEYGQRGLGARSAGQSGDTQGLSASPDVGTESVEELMEEGQSFEAEVLDGIEKVPDADEGEVRTKEVPEDDVPEEYQEPDRD